MTLVVTHAQGYLACFTRNPDGSMKQRALIDTGEEPPTALELANTGERFAQEFHWDQEVQPASTRSKVKALSPSTTKHAIRERQKRAQAREQRELQKKQKRTCKTDRDNDDALPIEQRKAMIVDYLRNHPDSTQAEVLEGLGLESTSTRRARWHHHFGALITAGTIVVIRERAGVNGNPKEFRLR